MSDPYDYDKDFGPPPEDYPVMREFEPVSGRDGPGADETAPEYAQPAPELIGPGEFEAEQKTDSSKKRLLKLKKLMMAFTAAALFLTAFRPLGLLFGDSGSAGTPSDPQAETAPDGSGAPAEEEYVYKEGDPFLRIAYALLDGDTVRYSYVAANDQQEFDPLTMRWKYPLPVYAVVTDESGRTAVPENDPDIWDSSRNLFEYEIDASGLKGDMVLTLTAAGDYDGTERKAVAKHDVIPKPPEPVIETSLSVNAAEDSYIVDYRATFTPDEKDTNDYDFEMTTFAAAFYDDAGEHMGGNNLAPTYRDDAEPAWPDVERDGRTWIFTYSGEADLLTPDEITKFALELDLRDKATDLPFTIFTDMADIPAPVVREAVEPQCEIVAYSIYSEMYAGVTFSDLDDVTSVYFEIWDPFTGSMEESRDITEEAFRDGSYSTRFTTDLFVENHSDYYSQEGIDFPMAAEFHVVMEYGGNTVTYSAVTSEELNMFDAKYIAESDAWAGDDAGTIYFTVMPSASFPDTQLLIDQPEAVDGPGVMSISVEIDGKKIDPSAITVNRQAPQTVTFYGGVDDGKTAEVVYTDVMIKKPEGIPDDSGYTAKLYVTSYLTSLGEVYTSEIDIPLEAYHE